jgi:hypothetical protein
MGLKLGMHVMHGVPLCVCVRERESISQLAVANGVGPLSAKLHAMVMKLVIDVMHGVPLVSCQDVSEGESGEGESERVYFSAGRGNGFGR